MADQGPTEQWENMIVRSQSGSNAQIVSIPHSPDAIGSAQPGYEGILVVLNNLGADGWRLVSADGVSDDGKDGRYWLRRRATMSRVARPEDSVH